MSMAEVGSSLDPASTLEAQARKLKLERRPMRAHVCVRCHEYPYPRGFCERLQLCWTCCFPRTTRGESV